MKTACIALFTALLSGLWAGPAWAEKEATRAGLGSEATGLFPGIESATSCNETCSETYEVKCTQSAKVLYIVVGDDWDGAPFGTRFSDTYVRAQVMGLAPAGINWKSQASLWIDPGEDEWFFTIVRPGSEGTIRVLALVQAFDAGDRLYAIDVWGCWSDVNVSYRNASIVKKADN